MVEKVENSWEELDNHDVKDLLQLIDDQDQDIDSMQQEIDDQEALIKDQQKKINDQKKLIHELRLQLYQDSKIMGEQLQLARDMVQLFHALANEVERKSEKTNTKKIMPVVDQPAEGMMQPDAFMSSQTELADDVESRQ